MRAMSDTEYTPKIDLNRLAESLATEKAVVEALRAAGHYGRLSGEARDVVNCAVQEFGKSQEWGDRDRLLMFVAIALTRRLVSGATTGAFSPEAIAFVEDRYFDWRGRQGEGTLGNYANAEEVLQLARYIYDNSDLAAQIHAFREHGLVPTKTQHDVCVDLELEFRREMGLTRRIGLSNAYLILSDLFDGNLTSPDDERARARISGAHDLRK